MPLLAWEHFQPRVLLQHVRWHGLLLRGVRRRLPGSVQGRHRVSVPATVDATVAVAAPTVAEPTATQPSVAEPAAAVALATTTLA